METPSAPLATAELLALCKVLLDRAEGSLDLLPVIEPEVLAHLTNASRAGFCSRIALRRINARLNFLRRLAFGLAQRPNHGLGRG